MAFAIILSVVFVVMLLAPLMMGYFAIDRSEDSTLIIRRDNIRDPRYFSRAFGKLVENALAAYNGEGTIHLSREEPLTFAEDIPAGADQFDTLVVAQQTFSSGEVRQFSKEIYARHDASLQAGCKVRAIASGQRLVMEENCGVLRWVDAETGLYARSGCDLGISASSGSCITLDVGCSFDRLYAPEIIVEHDFQTGEVDQGLLRLLSTQRPTGKSAQVRFNVRSVGAGAVMDNTLITRHNLCIDENAVVYGDVKGGKNIRIRSGAIISGNVFADGDIVVEDNVYIGGVVFSQESVFLGTDSVVGRFGAIKSLIAREEIVLCNGSAVFGYIHCERGGRTVDEREFAEVISTRF